MTLIDLKSRPTCRPFRCQHEALIFVETVKPFEGFQHSRQNLDKKIGPIAQNNVLESCHQVRHVAPSRSTFTKTRVRI
jgi:hypothetical protein